MKRSRPKAPSASKGKKATPFSSQRFLLDLLVGPSSFNWKWFLTLNLGIFLTGFLMLQMDRFRWLGAPFTIPQPLWGILWTLGIVLLFLGFRALPEGPSKGDLPRWAAYPLLAGIFAVAAGLRFHRADQAYLAYWDDPATILSFFLQGCDFHHFSVIYPEGATEGLYVWVGSVIWWLFPQMKALFLERLTADLFQFAAIWVFYRLGREVTGKRSAGLLLAALGAASKPLLLHNLSVQNALTLPLSTSLYLWFQFKVFRKPSLRHFIQWGAALALGLYTYNAVRTWYLYLILVTLGWVLTTRFKGLSLAQWKWPAPSKLKSSAKDRLDQVTGALSGKFVPWAVLGFTILYLAYLLDHVLFLFPGNFLSKLWGWDWRIWLLLNLGLGVLFFQACRASKPKDQTLYAWAFGVLVAGFFSNPLALHTEAAVRIGQISLLPQSFAGFFGAAFYVKMWDQVHMAFQWLFTVGSDRTDMNVFGDPVFDYHAEVLAVLGFTALLARPSWRKILLVAALPVGIAPFLLTTDSHGAKLLGGVLPVLLLAVLALVSWLGSGFQLKNRWIGWVPLAAFAAFWVWEIQGTFTRVFDVWWTAVVNDDLAYGQEVDKALPDHRVYLAGSDKSPYRFVSAYVQAVLHDGSPVYFFQNDNPIPLFPGDKAKDVALIVSGYAKELLDRVRKEYPSAQWTPHWQFYQKSKEEIPDLYTILIPAAEITRKPGAVFYFKPADHLDWVRRCYTTGFGLRGGTISTEDTSPTLNPGDEKWKLKGISGDGRWVVPVDGTYHFTMINPNPARLTLDGKILMQNPNEGEPVTVTAETFVTKGEHPIRYFTYCMYGSLFPDVTIENKEIGYKKVLGTAETRP